HRRQLDHRVVVPGGLGVPDQHRVVVHTHDPPSQRGQDGRMKTRPPARRRHHRYRRLDQLVPKLQPNAALLEQAPLHYFLNPTPPPAPSPPPQAPCPAAPDLRAYRSPPRPPAPAASGPTASPPAPAPRPEPSKGSHRRTRPAPR